MKKIILVLVLFCAFIACKKNQLGGKATINGVVSHHEKRIGKAVVYIKFNAKEFPGTDSSKYDASVIANEAGEFKFECYKGDYYLYGTGLDFRPAATYVNGGVPVKLRNKEKVDITVAVSEPH